VLTGFLTGVAANIILGQLGHLLGSPQKGSPALVKAFNVVIHPGDMSLTAAAVGLAALALMVILTRTRIASVASLVGLAVMGSRSAWCRATAALATARRATIVSARSIISNGAATPLSPPSRCTPRL
jgi:MFS superfamily sulfate permease-like transporter